MSDGPGQGTGQWTSTANIIRVCVALAALALPAASHAGDVDRLLERDAPPPGVVFEIIAWNDAFLQQALPRVRSDIARLRKRFPDMAFAVVSHGAEQFALLVDERFTYPLAHAVTRSLLADNVPVHVCGTHASWRGVSEEDFPDYVDVAASGPAQINDYLALDYVLVRLTAD